MSVTSDVGSVVSEALLLFIGSVSFRSGIRIWREKPPPSDSPRTHDDRRPQWFIVGALPTALCVLSMAIAFPLSYGLQSRVGFFADFCFVVGGLFFLAAALCVLVLVVEVVLLFFERPVPRLLTPPSRRSEPEARP
jgi:hypothetical protein